MRANRAEGKQYIPEVHAQSVRGGHCCVAAAHVDGDGVEERLGLRHLLHIDAVRVQAGGEHVRQAADALGDLGEATRSVVLAKHDADVGQESLSSADV